MGDEVDPGDFDGPGDIGYVYSEQALRGFYRRWGELLADNA